MALNALFRMYEEPDTDIDYSACLLKPSQGNISKTAMPPASMKDKPLTQAIVPIDTTACNASATAPTSEVEAKSIVSGPKSYIHLNQGTPEHLKLLEKRAKRTRTVAMMALKRYFSKECDITKTRLEAILKAVELPRLTLFSK